MVQRLRSSPDPGNGLGLENLAEPHGARLRYPCLRSVVHVDDAESTAVSVGPLEVVHERPDKVTAHIDSRARRCVEAAQWRVQECNRLDVIAAALWVHVIIQTRAVFSHENGQVRVLGMNAGQDVEQPIGPDRQPTGSQRSIGRAPLAAVHTHPTRYDLSLVVRDSYEPNPRANHLA